MFIFSLRIIHRYKTFFRCKLGIVPDTDVADCHIKYKPSVSKKQLYIMVLFGNGVLMSFWVWTSHIGNAWCECLVRWCVLILLLIIQF